jgi:hypothetical protein
LLGWNSTTYQELCHPFCIGYFWDRVSLYACADLDHDLQYVLPWVAGVTGSHHHTQALGEMDGDLRTFCLGWLWITILPISTSQVARITDVAMTPNLFCFVDESKHLHCTA